LNLICYELMFRVFVKFESFCEHNNWVMLDDGKILLGRDAVFMKQSKWYK
jgi:hypothetical protein